MGKLYTKYKSLKEKDTSILYLFRSGIFYIGLDEDAKNISKITTLCLTNLNKDVVKCGFPKNSIDKYMEIFNNLELDIKIVNNNDKDKDVINDKIVKMIKDIDIDRFDKFTRKNES